MCRFHCSCINPWKAFLIFNWSRLGPNLALISCLYATFCFWLLHLAIFGAFYLPFSLGFLGTSIALPSNCINCHVFMQLGRWMFLSLARLCGNLLIFKSISHLLSLPYADLCLRPPLKDSYFLDLMSSSSWPNLAKVHVEYSFILMHFLFTFAQMSSFFSFLQQNFRIACPPFNLCHPLVLVTCPDSILDTPFSHCEISIDLPFEC